VLSGLAVLFLQASAASAQIHSELVVSGLDHPVAFVQDPSQPNVQFIVEQRGHIRVLLGGALQADDFLDLSSVVSGSPDDGLLGLAFPPDYGERGRFFVHFTNADDHVVIARFVRTDGFHADPASRFDLLWPDGNTFIWQPECCHYGGNLAFGPDGYLYIGLGDGADSDDTWNSGQRPDTLLGKMLRINVTVPDDDPEGYDVPADNPFVDQAGVLPEIWAFGFRNPWRYSFDDPAKGGTGALIVGDVGQVTAEEFDYEPAGHGGRNYGWRVREGAFEHITTEPAFSAMTDPVYQYGRDIGRCIIGGIVYRGQALGSAYFGRYFFGDFGLGRLWSAGLTLDGAGEATLADLHDHQTEAGVDELATIVAFGTDAAGELYFLNYKAGTVYRLAPGAGSGSGSGGGSGGGGSGGGSGSSTNWGDFSGDGKTDLIWQHPVSGAVLLWTMNGTEYIDSIFLNAGGTYWQVVGTGDFDGDGHLDVLWQHPDSGALLLWQMFGATYTGSTLISAGGTYWKVVAVADFTADGKPDILWQHPATGAVLLWTMDGTSLVSSTIIHPGSTLWRIAAAVDVSGDGHPDLLWQDPNSGVVLVWIMSGFTYADYALLTPPAPTWRLAAAGDYTGDGKPDLIWQDTATGAVWCWEMDGTTMVSSTLVNAGTMWQVRAPK